MTYPYIGDFWKYLFCSILRSLYCLIILERLSPFSKLNSARKRVDYCRFIYGHIVHETIIKWLTKNKRHRVEHKSSENWIIFIEKLKLFSILIIYSVSLHHLVFEYEKNVVSINPDSTNYMRSPISGIKILYQGCNPYFSVLYS